MGHQIPELGFAFKDGFFPLDRQMYVGETRTHLLNGEFNNAKSKWKTFSAEVKINLSEDKKNEEWIDIKLVFSAPKNQTEYGIS